MLAPVFLSVTRAQPRSEHADSDGTSQVTLHGGNLTSRPQRHPKCPQEHPNFPRKH